MTSKKVIPRTTSTMLLVVEKVNKSQKGGRNEKGLDCFRILYVYVNFLVKTKGKLLKIKGNTSTKNLDNGTILLGYKKMQNVEK